MVTAPPTWSIVLQSILKSSAERQRLSSALGVTTMTLSRWASGESKPQRNHLIHLLQVVLPHQTAGITRRSGGTFPEISCMARRG